MKKNQTFNIHKTKVMTSFFAFLCFSSYIGCILLFTFTKVMVIIPYLLLLFSAALSGIVTYYILKLDEWKNEKEEVEK